MKQSLSFAWNYADNFQKDYLKELPKNHHIIDVPHNIQDVPYNYFDEHIYQKVVTYEKYFDVDDNISNKVSLLRFEAFMLQADIYLNDVFLGHFVSGYLPVEIDVSSCVKQKGNRLLVILDSKEDNHIPPFGFAVDYLTFSGIYREVYLLTFPKTYIKDLYAYGDMQGNTYIHYEKIGEDDISLSFEILDEEGKTIAKTTQNVFKLDNPHLWNIDVPYQYTLLVKASNGEIYETKFGYRDAIFTNEGFYLNNKFLKLRGLNRHQCYPHVGYAMPKSMQENDAIKLKELGINIVRTSHYPQSEWFLNKCDELGILVIDEIPGWQHIGQEESWRNLYYEFVKKMVLKERHHVSLVAYGVRIDESCDDHELYKKGNQIAHELDKYRPTIGVRNFWNSELLEDIYGYNDFTCADMTKGLSNPNKYTKEKDAPVLVTEYMGHMEPVKVTSDLDKRKLVALRHAKVLDDALKYDRTCGSIGWCFVDYYTHVDFGSGDHICPHGVSDMYRNKKYSAAIYESQQDDHPVLEVLTNMRPGDFKESTYQDIYVATNMDRVDLYKNDELVASFYPKNDQFKYLKHPPILINDVLGATFNDERFTKKERKLIAEAFSYAGIHGFSHIKLKHKLLLAKILMKYHLKWNDVVDIWNTHIATWGGYAKTFTFKGIKENKEVIVKRIAPSLEFHYEYLCPRNELIVSDTYDVLPIVVRFVDPDGTVMPYANRAIKVTTEGNVSILGPELQTLLGGQITIYVRSLNKGNGKVIISNEMETKEIELVVR